MQQRRLRLGDILDDYCPRERRVTNHAVVAMIEDQVKQTRCTTCDADHEYKEARVPAPRRKKDTGALSETVGDAPGVLLPDALEEPDSLDSPVLLESEPLADAIAVAEEAAADDDPPEIDDDGPVHRPLIRATLPRPEGQLPEWKEPEFTIRQPGRDGNRPGGGGGGRHRRPMRAGGGPPGPMTSGSGASSRFGSGSRSSGPRHGSGQGQPQRQNGNGNRPGGPQGGGRGPGRPDQRGPGRKRGR
jgi:hypothetical protein